MGVNKKGFRKVKYKGCQYLWAVREVKEKVPERGFVSYVSDRYLHIIASNKSFIIRYRLPKPGDEFTYLYNDGKPFLRASQGDRITVPRWRHDSKRYPTADFVRRLIHWCLSPEP